MRLNVDDIMLLLLLCFCSAEFNPFNPNPIVPGDSDFIATMEDILECSPSSLCTCVQNSFNSLSSAGYGTVEGLYEISVFQNQSIAAGDFVLALFGSSAVFALPILANVERMNFSCTSQTLDAHTFSTTAYHSLFLDLLNITDVSLTIGVHVSATGILSYLKLLGVQGWGGLQFDIDVDLTDDNTWTFEASTAGDIDLVSFVNDAFNANFPSDPIKTTILLTNHKFNGIVDVAAGYEFYLVVRGTLQIGNWFQHDVCIVVHHILSGGQSPNVFIMTGYTALSTLSITLDSLISSLSGVNISRLTFFNNLNLNNYHLTFATPNFTISNGRLSQLDLPFIPSAIRNNLSGLEFVFDLSVPTLGAIQRWALSYSSSLNTAVLHPVSTVDDNVPLVDMFSFISNTLTVPTVPLVETDVTNFDVVEISLPFDDLESRVVISISHTIEIVENLILFVSANITFPISLNGGVSLGQYIISGHFDIAQVGFSATIEYDRSSYQCRGKAEGFPSGVSGLLDIFIPGQTVRDIQDFFSASSNSVGKRAAVTSFGSSPFGITDILIKFLPQRYAEELCWDGTVYSGQYATVLGALCIFDLQDYTLGFDVTDFVVANFIHGTFGDPVYHVPFFNQKLDTILVYSSFDSGKLPWTSPTYRYLEQRSLLKGVSFYSVSSWPDPCSTEFCIEARSLLGANAVFHLYTYIRSFDHLVLQAGLNDFMFGDFKVTNALLLVEFKKPNIFIGLNGTIEIPDYSLRLDGAIQLKYPTLQIVADFTLNSTLPTCTDVTSVILEKPPSILKKVKIDFCYVYLYARLGQGISRPSANFGLVVGIGDRSCYRLELAAFAGMLSPKPTSTSNPTEFEDKYILAETHDKITLLSIIDMLFCTRLSGSLLSFFLDIGFTSGFTVSTSTVEYTVPQTGLYIRKGLYIRGSFMFLWKFHRYAELHFDPPDVIDIKVGLPPVNLAGGLIKLVESRTRDTIGPSVRFVLRNIPSFNFLLELSGYARLLGIAAEGKLSISHERCSMFIAGRIFGVLSAELTVYANYGSLLSADWGVQGVLQSNVLKAIEDAVVAVIKAAGELVSMLSKYPSSSHSIVYILVPPIIDPLKEGHSIVCYIHEGNAARTLFLNVFFHLVQSAYILSPAIERYLPMDNSTTKHINYI